jgi:hypothetical protein
MAKAQWMALVALVALTTGCMTYRGPYGVEDVLERKMGVELHREFGIKLGPLSTKFAASFVGHDDDLDLRDVTRVGVAVFEVAARNGAAPQRIEPRDLGGSGWTTALDARDGDEQVLLLVKSRGGSIHDMMLLTVDSDEVVVARLTGHLDEMLAKAMNGAKHEGARGAVGAVGFSAR